ncbi:MAG: hypothetical protein GXY34_12755, partial [Syntrophomonadaceae bacterium]|nr:hypothetical protein [Syntrophomonadaceae bacterium]
MAVALVIDLHQGSTVFIDDLLEEILRCEAFVGLSHGIGVLTRDTRHFFSKF